MFAGHPCCSVSAISSETRALAERLSAKVSEASRPAPHRRVTAMAPNAEKRRGIWGRIDPDIRFALLRGRTHPGAEWSLLRVLLIFVPLDSLLNSCAKPAARHSSRRLA